MPSHSLPFPCGYAALDGSSDSDVPRGLLMLLIFWNPACWTLGDACGLGLKDCRCAISGNKCGGVGVCDGRVVVAMGSRELSS